MKRLSERPTLHEPVRAVEVEYGVYTEVGEYSYLENVLLGDYSYCGQFCYFQNTVIGKFANIAAAVRIGPTMHPMDRPTQHHFTYRRVMYGFDDRDDEAFFARRRARLTYVGHDTWIGHGAIIMPGVKIGDGAVVGSGAVVTKDVEPYTVAVGVPARFVKRRFEPDVAAALGEIAWWDWPHDVIKERLADFSLPVADFVATYAIAAEGGRG